MVTTVTFTFKAMMRWIALLIKLLKGKKKVNLELIDFYFCYYIFFFFFTFSCAHSVLVHFSLDRAKSLTGHHCAVRSCVWVSVSVCVWLCVFSAAFVTQLWPSSVDSLPFSHLSVWRPSALTWLWFFFSFTFVTWKPSQLTCLIFKWFSSKFDLLLVIESSLH